MEPPLACALNKLYMYQDNQAIQMGIIVAIVVVVCREERHVSRALERLATAGSIRSNTKNRPAADSNGITPATTRCTSTARGTLTTCNRYARPTGTTTTVMCLVQRAALVGGRKDLENGVVAVLVVGVMGVELMYMRGRVGAEGMGRRRSCAEEWLGDVRRGGGCRCLKRTPQKRRR